MDALNINLPRIFIVEPLESDVPDASGQTCSSKAFEESQLLSSIESSMGTVVIDR